VSEEEAEQMSAERVGEYPPNVVHFDHDSDEAGHNSALVGDYTHAT